MARLDDRISAELKTPDDQVSEVTIRRRVWLVIEMVILFGLTPILVYMLLYEYRMPLFQILPPVFLVFIVFLTFDRTFSWKKLLLTGVSFKQLLSILMILAIAGPGFVIFAQNDVPERFLTFPRYAYDIWVMVMIMYPLISVTTQEIMYRVFFFHRYKPLFERDPQGAIVLNAVLFSFSHIVFQNVTTLIISLLGGLLFAWRYQSSKSYWALVLEHSIYGNLIFTVGLGKYFYTGVSNF
ncbi:MAG: CPBP family intramembrane metalloprotease [Hyphomicrobiales bacterium]|nr:CPBP family intramembrane metalloprotease [Hyphomicrobiales bacterium]